MAWKRQLAAARCLLRPAYWVPTAAFLAAAMTCVLTHRPVAAAFFAGWWGGALLATRVGGLFARAGRVGGALLLLGPALRGFGWVYFFGGSVLVPPLVALALSARTRREAAIWTGAEFLAVAILVVVDAGLPLR